MGFFLGTIFGGIWRLIRFLINLVARLFAKIITSLNLSLPFFYALAGLLLHLAFGLLQKGSDSFYVYHFGLVAVLIFSVAVTVKKALAPGHRRRAEQPAPDYMARISADRPRVFRVRDNPDYVVYEFYDRYQLFKEDRHGELQYVRTDYKEHLRQ